MPLHHLNSKLLVLKLIDWIVWGWMALEGDEIEQDEDESWL